MQKRATHSVISFLVLFGFWVVLSGHFDLLHLAYGVVSAALVTWLSAGLLYTKVDGGEDRYLTLLPWGRLMKYWAYLTLEIIKANLQVLKLVLGPRRLLDPSFITVDCDLRSEVSRVTYANSITLTPGTVTIDVLPDGRYLVHAIDKASADGLRNGAMERRIAAAFGEQRVSK